MFTHKIQCFIKGHDWTHFPPANSLVLSVSGKYYEAIPIRLGSISRYWGNGNEDIRCTRCGMSWYKNLKVL